MFSYLYFMSSYIRLYLYRRMYFMFSVPFLTFMIFHVDITCQYDCRVKLFIVINKRAWLCKNICLVLNWAKKKKNRRCLKFFYNRMELKFIYLIIKWNSSFLLMFLMKNKRKRDLMYMDLKREIKWSYSSPIWVINIKLYQPWTLYLMA